MAADYSGNPAAKALMKRLDALWEDSTAAQAELDAALATASRGVIGVERLATVLWAYDVMWHGQSPVLEDQRSDLREMYRDRAAIFLEALAGARPPEVSDE